MREVEPRIEPQRHQGRRSVDQRRAADDAENRVIGIGADSMNTAGKIKGLVQVLALHPKLKFARNVPGIIPDFESGHNHGPDGPGCLLGM